MSFRASHPKHHRLLRIFNREDVQLFPTEIQLSLRRLKEAVARPYQNIVEQFENYTQSLADDGAIVTVSRLSSTLKVFLGQVILETKEFSQTTELAVCVRKFKVERNLKRVVIAGYLAKLKKFMDFIELHAIDSFTRFKNYPWEKVLAEVRPRYQSAAQRDKRLKSKELFSKVPTLQEVQEINFLVQDFLNADLTERVLHYKELQTLNFVVLSFRLNCRAGPLLNLTWEDVKTIQKLGALDTDAHKTGKFFDVTIQTQEDQFKWLKRLKSRYVKEFKVVPTLVFASPTNKVEHSLSKNIRVVLSQLFGKKDGVKDFHATAVRKTWDTHFHTNQQKYKDSVFTSHLHQTGRSASTARDKYVVPADKSEALNTYLKEFSKMQDSTDDGEVTFNFQDQTSTPKNATKQPRSSCTDSIQSSRTSHSATPRTRCTIDSAQSSTVTPEPSLRSKNDYKKDSILKSKTLGRSGASMGQKMRS